MAGSAVSAADYMALHSRNAELATEVRILKEQLAIANNGTTHIINLMGMQTAQAESASKQELRRALEENAFLKERLMDLPTGRMAFLTNENMRDPNTFYDSTPNTELTSVSLLDHDTDLQLCNKSASTLNWTARGVQAPYQRGDLLIPETSNLMGASDQPKLEETQVAAPEHDDEDDDDLFDFGDSKLGKARTNAQGSRLNHGNYQPSALMARPGPLKVNQTVPRAPRQEHQRLPLQVEHTDGTYMRMMGAATFIEDDIEGKDETELVAYWEEHAAKKLDNYTSSAWRDYYEQQIQPNFLSQQLKLEGQRAQEQSIAVGQAQANDELVVLQKSHDSGSPQRARTNEGLPPSFLESENIEQDPKLGNIDIICTGKGTVHIGKRTSSDVVVSTQEEVDIDNSKSTSTVNHFVDLHIDEAVRRQRSPEDIELPTEDDDDFSDPNASADAGGLGDPSGKVSEASEDILLSAQGLGASTWAAVDALPPLHLRRSHQSSPLRGSPEQLEAARAFNEGLIRGGGRGRQREQCGYRTRYQDHCETSEEGVFTASRMRVQRFKGEDVKQYGIAGRRPRETVRPVGFYQRGSTDPLLRRTVLISGIRNHTTLVEVIDQVLEGPLYNAIFLETSTMKLSKPLGNTVLLEFFHGQDANAFARRCTETPLLLREDSGNQHYGVPTTSIPTPTCPLPIDIERCLQDNAGSLTRTLFLRDHRCQLTEDYVVDKLSSRNGSSLPIRVIVERDGYMTLEYASVREAKKAWERMSRCREFNPLDKGFVADRVLGGRLLSATDGDVKEGEEVQDVGAPKTDEQVGEAGKVGENDEIDGYLDVEDAEEPQEVSETKESGEVVEEGKAEAGAGLRRGGSGRRRLGALGC